MDEGGRVGREGGREGRRVGRERGREGRRVGRERGREGGRERVSCVTREIWMGIMSTLRLLLKLHVLLQIHVHASA